MGFWSGFGKVLGAAAPIIAAPFTGGGSLAALPAILGAGGAALGAAGQGMAQNRGAEFQGQMDLERLLMDRDRDRFGMGLQREQEGRLGRDDAWRKLLSSQRVLSPSARPQLSPYSMAPRQATDMERQGADALSAEVMARLQGGNPIAMPAERPMEVDRSKLKSGVLERIFGIASPVLSVMGQPQRES